MDTSDTGNIEELVAEALARLEEHGPGALEALCAEHPGSAAALRARVEWLLETGLARTPAPAPRDYPERLGDFRLLEPIGQGGMGVVYRAEQLSLGRQVALKLVRPDQLYFPGALQRFETEVATVAALAHPGIVPIFAVGQEDGVPFFAMEHVRGASLGQVIARLEGRAPRELTGADLVEALDALGADPEERASSLFEGPWPTVCARLAREVAEALEHAHRRGVLHRDVKPSNVMVTRGGRVMLVDFGLASREAQDGRRTRTGQRVGTLAYMAPEQLRGARALDARTDVFALGIVLYELLTLQLPYDASSEAERLARAHVSVPANLRKLDPRVPWELETVVQTATDPDPARRYASAEELAQDLGHVLAARPILARRSSAALRARRWVQRHPAAALAGLVLAVAPTVFAVQELRANAALAAKSGELQVSNAALGQALEEAGRERAEAETARARAERHFERAYEAVELMLGRVGGDLLEGVPRMEPIRRGLLQDALRLHEELLGDPAADASQPRLYARTLRRAAALRAELGQLDEALATLDEEAAVLDGLLAAGPDPELELERGTLEFRRAEVSKLLDDLPAAEQHARRAVERLAPLAAADSGVEGPWSLARARTELADVLTLAGRPDEARAELLAVTDTLRGLAEGGQGLWAQRAALARALHLLAAYPTTHIPGQAAEYDPLNGERYLREALELRRRLALEQPENPAGLNAVAESGLALGGTLIAQGRFAESHDLHREVLAAYEQLSDSFPARPMYAEGLATTCYNMSLLAAAGDREEERRALLERALTGYGALAAADPDNLSYRRKQVLALGQLGHALQSTGSDLEHAELALAQALELGTPLWRDDGEDGDLRTLLVWATGLLARTRLALGDPAGAAAAARGYAALDPTPVEQAWEAQFLAAAVAAGRAAGLAEATLAAWTEEALELLERAGGNAPRDPQVRRELADPMLAPVGGEERYLALLALLGVDPPRR